MSLLAWNPRWETGAPEIDGQHRELFLHFDQIFEAVAQHREAEQVAQTLQFMASYVESHFRMEEDLMERFAYPGKAPHHAIHEGLRAQVKDLIAAHQRDPAAVTEEVPTFLAEWLISHIDEQDRALAAYVKSHPASAR